MENIHLAISSSIRKILLATSGDVSPAPVCGYGGARLEMSFAHDRVTCPRCLEAEKERKTHVLEQFLLPEERRLVAQCLSDFAFYPWYCDKQSESFLWLLRKDGEEGVYIRRCDGIRGGEMITRDGLTVKDGYLWVEWFRHGECLGCKLVGDGRYWTAK